MRSGRFRGGEGVDIGTRSFFACIIFCGVYRRERSFIVTGRPVHRWDEVKVEDIIACWFLRFFGGGGTSFLGVYERRVRGWMGWDGMGWVGRITA